MNEEPPSLSATHAEFFHDLPVALAVLDARGYVLGANEALCGLLNYTQDEITTLTWGDLLDPQNQGSDPTAQEDDLTRHQHSLVDARGQRVFCDVYSTSSEQGRGERVWLTALVDVGQRHRYIGQLEHETNHDELTGLLNRKGTQRLLGELLGDDSSGQLAALFCDVDNFKRINDSLGHEVGDELLVTLADRLTRGLPPGCTPARHSGDEFLIICSDLQGVGGLDTLTDTVSTLLGTTLAPHGYQIAISASIGTATAGTSARTPEDLLRSADAAMYQVKGQDSGRIAYVEPALSTSLEQEVPLEEQLRRAIPRDELTVHYQPIVDRAGHVISAEALLRWPHPQHGLLSPGSILPAARRAGLLSELDAWVLRTAVREAAAWPASEDRSVGIAINVGSQLLHDPGFTEIVTSSGLAWDRLVLEITETDLLDLADSIHQAMAELVARGVRFAVDDFGTGYSSLERLKDLPVQIIKLDRKFVSGVEDDPVDTAIAGAALSIAHARGSTCIAEGVETTGQLYRLASLGYDTHQGFLFSAAVPEPDLRAFITHPPTLTGTGWGTSHNLINTDPPQEPGREHTVAAKPHNPPTKVRRQGEVTDARRLVPGGHLCWPYEHPEQFQTRTREYVLDGIRAGQWIEYVGNAPASQLWAQLATDDTLAPALASGQIAVSPMAEFYRLDQDTSVIDPDATLEAQVAGVEKVLAAGYNGFCAVIDATFLARTRAQREAQAHFEYLIDHTMSDLPLNALCAYDLNELGSSAVAELACLHPLTSPHASPFRLYTEHPDTGGGGQHGHLALAGNVDLPCADLLTQALRHARQDELLINDRGLEVFDRGALLALDRHARESNQKLTLRLAQPLATRLAPLVELTHTRIETQPH